MKEIPFFRHFTNLAAVVDEGLIFQVCNLWNIFNGSLLSKEEFIGKILNGKYELILALKDDEVIGFALCEVILSPLKNSSYLEVWALYVSESHQTKSLGRMLLEEIASYANNIGCFDVHASADKKPGVVDFYRACGYNDYAIRMRKEVK